MCVCVGCDSKGEGRLSGLITIILGFYLTTWAQGARQPGAGPPPPPPPQPEEEEFEGPGCNMLRQIVYSPLSLLAAALRIDKHEQRMSALYCCDLNGEMSKQTVGVGRLQDASQESTFKPNTHEKKTKTLRRLAERTPHFRAV